MQTLENSQVPNDLAVHAPLSTAAQSGGFSGRAVFATRWGGPTVLRVGEHHVPPPGAGEVVIEVRAAGVAFGDIMLREGLRRDLRPPAIPGYDAAGMVVAIGTDVTDVQPGDSVAVKTRGDNGGYATHVLAPSWAVIPYPAHLDPAAVTSLVLNYLTAFQLLTRAAPIANGATILVHSAAGGVGSALLQLGALRGLRMFGTASAGKARFVAAHGGIPIDYRSEDYARRVRAEAPEGIDAVFDGLGGSSWRQALPLLRPGGHLVIYGASAGFKEGRRSLPSLLSAALRAPRTSYLTYFQRGVGVTGYNSSAIIPAHPDWYRQDLSHLIGLLADGAIAPAIHRVFPLLEAAEAQRELGAGRVTGKIVLRP